MVVFISFYRMMPQHVVKHFFKNNVCKLAIHFMTDSYMEGCGFFYMALKNNYGHTNGMTPSVVAKWSTEWKEVNEEFENKFLIDDDLKIFSNKMFMVWDESHRLHAWMPIIMQFHIYGINWYFCVEGIVLDPREDVPSVITAFHKINL
jgi:hypothetical protein